MRTALSTAFAFIRIPCGPTIADIFSKSMRIGQGPAADFDPKTTQVSAALSYPGTIKAFHFHKHQTDLWVPSAGMFQVALVDLRGTSPTFGVKNTLYLGALRTWQILIPPGVGHGYKVIGESTGHAGLRDQSPVRSRR